MIDKNKTYYTRDGKAIPGKNVLELDKEGYVMTSARWIILDFNKDKHDK